MRKSGDTDNRRADLALMIAYFASLELVARMAKTSPWVPYELSKYLMFGMLLLGTSLSARGRLGWLMALLLLPAVFIDLSGLVTGYQPIVFNLLGPVNTALAIVFFSRLPMDTEHFQRLLLVVLFAMAAALSFTFFNTPDYDSIEFSLAANFDTAGGFGSNQVSTGLGLGMFLSFLFWFNRWPLTGYRLLDGFLMFGFAFQGLLTFSRGGMIGGALGILIVLFVISLASTQQRKKLRLPSVGKYAIPAIILSGFAFNAVNTITGGMLLLRYQGETQGTLAGHREKTINVLTTNRYDIFIADLDVWSQNPVFGVGVGASRFLREKVEYVVAHVELSRLLSEHGLGGLLYFILLCTYPVYTINRVQHTLIRGIQWALFIIAIYTTFHAAMRTFTTPLLIGISLVSVLTTAKK
ncbi:MAG: hypothetical protein SFV52_03010 [Saprospiraceae bacterium]|nr:hypothetical protein [Saprospiraceae bacterium]